MEVIESRHNSTPDSFKNGFQVARKTSGKQWQERLLLDDTTHS